MKRECINQIVVVCFNIVMLTQKVNRFLMIALFLLLVGPPVALDIIGFCAVT